MASQPHKVVLILAGAGLKMGKDGLVDCYDRVNSTGGQRSNDPKMKFYRPDIVHQCLLAAYDSLFAIHGTENDPISKTKNNDGLAVLIVTTEGIIIELSSALRPPRTYNRFKGLMETLFREGVIRSKEGGQTLMKKVNNQHNSSTMSTLAPYIPYGARVIGLSNAHHAQMQTPVTHAAQMIANPVDNNLQGGLRSVGTDKNVYGFYVIACNDQAELFPSASNAMMNEGDTSGSGENFYNLFVNDELALSPLPSTPHNLCLRLLEGYYLAKQMGTSNSSGAINGLVKREVVASAPNLPQPRDLSRKPEPKKTAEQLKDEKFQKNKPQMNKVKQFDNSAGSSKFNTNHRGEQSGDRREGFGDRRGMGRQPPSSPFAPSASTTSDSKLQQKPASNNKFQSKASENAEAARAAPSDDTGAKDQSRKSFGAAGKRVRD